MQLARNGVREISCAEDLSQSAILVLGLLQMGVKDDEIAEYFIAPRDQGPGRTRRLKRARVFVGDVFSSELLVVRDFIEAGLPSTVHAELPYAVYGHSVFCDLCRSKVNVVPCPLCYARHPIHAPEERNTKSPPLPREATNHPPGSLHKIMVMAQRFEEGRAVFHPDDKEVNHGQLQ